MNEPVSVVQEAVNLSKAYIWRQFWKMKWITALLVGGMATYTIQTLQWLPLLGFDMFSFTIVTVGILIIRIRMNKLFIVHVERKRNNMKTPDSVWSEMGQSAWLLMIMSWMLMYWIVVLLFATTLTTNT